MARQQEQGEAGTEPEQPASGAEADIANGEKPVVPAPAEPAVDIEAEGAPCTGLELKEREE